MIKTMYDLIVIGGGAAGMLAAAAAAESGMNTALFERGEYTGKKLRITGKGRCNVTNNCSVKEVLENVPKNSRFLYSCVSRFSPSDVYEFFENLGVPLKTERGNRVFPVSDKAQDVVSALRRYMSDCGVHVIYERVTDIMTENGAVSGVCTKNSEYGAKYVILATGGKSYPLTGSTGDGYAMSRRLGHTVTELSPSLVPLEADTPVCAQMQGLSLKNVGLTVRDKNNGVVYKDFGEMLFTHFGMSGPLILSASSHMRDYVNNKYRICIDLKPALDEAKLDARLLRDFEANPNKNIANVLGGLLPSKMVPAALEITQIPPDTKINSVTKQQRAALLHFFKNFEIPVSKPRPIDEAIVTSGGIDVGEINPKTMESKIVSGLYFAGEIIDVDGYTGGFNLQIAWSTAYAAAQSVKELYYEA